MALRVRAAGVRIVLVDAGGRITGIGDEEEDHCRDLRGAMPEMV
jgi:hypothetical protein